MDNLKIIIDARMIDYHLHGIARYTFELVRGLARKNNVEVKLLINDIEMSTEVFKNIDVKFIKMKSKFLSPMEIIELPFVLNKFKKDYIFHSPSFSASPFIKLKSFITIHDLNHLALPQYYSKFHKYYYEYIVKPFALRCNKIFTVSQFSKDEIVKWLKCDNDKVVVTYNGIDKSFTIIKDEQVLSKVTKKYDLPKEFILYIGNLKPHKNVPTLLKAMKYIDDTILVLNGKPNDEMNMVIKELAIEKKVKFIGYVEDEDLACLYNLAKVFVFPSIYEGFGLPPLEAMASGCAVIVSDAECLKEIVKENKFLFEATNSIQLSEKIKLLLGDSEIMESFIKDGLKVSSNYIWEDCVRNTFQTYTK